MWRDSTCDPIPEDEKSWRAHLSAKAINRDCYVTAPAPIGKNKHPDFQVGGHMTPTEGGRVHEGVSCYVLPLCRYNNSQNENTPFEYAGNTRMQLRDGFMEGDLAVTFLARMPAAAPNAPIREAAGEMRIDSLSSGELAE
jgi:hypothetical protein